MPTARSPSIKWLGGQGLRDDIVGEIARKVLADVRTEGRNLKASPADFRRRLDSFPYDVRDAEGALDAALTEYEADVVASAP